MPDERLRVVADQYFQFGGKSPINDQNRALIAALRADLDAQNIALPIYWGNRNWHPYLRDTVLQMVEDGHRHAVAVVTSAYSSYSSCRQYRENIAEATAGTVLQVDKIGQFYDADGFVAPFVEGTATAFADARRAVEASEIAIAFTAHSIPNAFASACRYEDQLRRTAQNVVERAGIDCRWDLVFQSRSGAPHVPWLEPDINEHIVSLTRDNVKHVIVVPIGFLSDHQEVVYDLDFTAANTAREYDLQYTRVATPGTDARFVAMLRDRIVQHVNGENTLRCLGETCCLPPQRP